MSIHRQLSSLTVPNSIALTFDDGPDPFWTPKILELLQVNHIIATFFLISKKAKQFPDLTRKINSQGHLIGNHSDSHSFLFSFFSSVFKKEMEQSQAIFEEILGKRPRLFRPPRGIFTPMLLHHIEKIKMEFVLWSLMPGDYWFWHSSDRMKKKVSKKIKNGDILVFHDGLNLSNNDRSNTYHFLKEQLPELKKKYQFVTLETGLGVSGYFENNP